MPSKSLARIFRLEREPYATPKSVEDAIPIQRIWADGIFLVGKHKYAK